MTVSAGAIAPSSLAVRREYNLDAIAAAGNAPPMDTLWLANLSAFVQGVTVDNYSNCVVQVFFDRPPTSAPSASVPSQFFKTIPCLAQRVGIAIIAPAADIMRGSVYVEATQDKLAAAGGVSPNPILGTATWDYVNYDGGATFAV